MLIYTRAMPTIWSGCRMEPKSKCWPNGVCPRGCIAPEAAARGFRPMMATAHGATACPPGAQGVTARPRFSGISSVRKSQGEISCTTRMGADGEGGIGRPVIGSELCRPSPRWAGWLRVRLACSTRAMAQRGPQAGCRSRPFASVSYAVARSETEQVGAMIGRNQGSTS